MWGQLIAIIIVIIWYVSDRVEPMESLRKLLDCFKHFETVWDGWIWFGTILSHWTRLLRALHMYTALARDMAVFFNTMLLSHQVNLKNMSK